MVGLTRFTGRDVRPSCRHIRDRPQQVRQGQLAQVPEPGIFNIPHLLTDGKQVGQFFRRIAFTNQFGKYLIKWNRGQVGLMPFWGKDFREILNESKETRLVVFPENLGACDKMNERMGFYSERIDSLLLGDDIGRSRSRKRIENSHPRLNIVSTKGFLDSFIGKARRIGEPSVDRSAQAIFEGSEFLSRAGNGRFGSVILKIKQIRLKRLVLCFQYTHPHAPYS
ncbi:MAG: hypothetical protein IT210_20975 [Armatimonadetes bacterium]|nr:hypothetical protein [Armatimonadota bacterium]